MKKQCVILLIVVVFISMPLGVRAGKLDGFEDAATKKKPSSGHSHDSNKSDDEDDDNFFVSIMFDFVRWAFIQSGKMSMARIHGGYNGDGITIPARAWGEPALPFFRSDLNYQWVDPDIYALDGRIEAGIGPVAGQIRSTRFKEEAPDDTLDLTYVHGLFRVSGSRLFELDLGLGSISLEGNEKNSGFSLTVPLSFFAFGHLGIRIVPTFGWINENSIRDLDLCVAYVFPYGSLQAGFRNIEVSGEVLNGPYAGFSFFF